MAIARLSLSDFRSYADATLTPGSGFVVLTGDNGAGKTNILEAVSLLAPGRGLRRAGLGEMARNGGKGGFAVNSEIDGVSIGTGTMAQAPERRLVRINGAAAAASALSEWLSIVWLTPAMDRLFADSAGERRRFFDRLVLALNPGHARHSTRYEAALRQRNRLLAEASPDAQWFSALEAQMGEHGAALGAGRLALLERLNEAIDAAPSPDFPKAALALDGWQGSDDLARDLTAHRTRDLAAGRTLVGPHRSDLVVTHLEKQQPAAQSSTGEQKALLLTIVLAHAALVAAHTGRRPILLLDEIAAHLDPGRRAALFEQLATCGGQVWMTGTEDAPFAPIMEAASHFRVEPGRILPIYKG